MSLPRLSLRGRPNVTRSNRKLGSLRFTSALSLDSCRRVGRSGFEKKAMHSPLSANPSNSSCVTQRWTFLLQAAQCLIPAVFVSESSNQSLGHSNSISQFRNSCVAALESDADILEILSRFVRDVATSALHDDATCVNGVRFKISSLSYADRITIADCKKVVARTEVAEIDRTSVAPSRLNNSGVAWATRSKLH